MCVSDGAAMQREYLVARWASLPGPDERFLVTAALTGVVLARPSEPVARREAPNGRITRTASPAASQVDPCGTPASVATLDLDLSPRIAAAPAGSAIRVEFLLPRAPADPTTTIAKLRETAGITAYANRGEDVTAADEAEFFHHAVDQAEKRARAGDRRDFELRLQDAIGGLFP